MPTAVINRYEISLAEEPDEPFVFVEQKGEAAANAPCLRRYPKTSVRML